MAVSFLLDLSTAPAPFFQASISIAASMEASFSRCLSYLLDLHTSEDLETDCKIHSNALTTIKDTFQTAPQEDTLDCHPELHLYFLITAVSFRLEG
jgi:hypothetical protein